MTAEVAGESGQSDKWIPCLRDASQRQSMEIIRKETTYRNRNAVQTYPATSLAFAGSRRHKSRPSMNIVTHAYRPKRKRKAQGATIAGPVIVTAKSKRTLGRRPTWWRPTNRQKPAIVTARNPAEAGLPTCRIRRRRSTSAEAMPPLPRQFAGLGGPGRDLPRPSGTLILIWINADGR